MKRMLLLAALGLLCTSFAVAQDMSPQSSQAGSGASDRAGTIQGCLSGSDGNYMLAQDQTGTMYKLVGSENQLKKHVGHEVMITGQMSPGSAASTSDEANSAASASAGASNDNTVQVSDVKMVSKHCSSGTEAPPSH